jgi:hypothetical protein
MTASTTATLARRCGHLVLFCGVLAFLALAGVGVWRACRWVGGLVSQQVAQQLDWVTAKGPADAGR